MKAIRKTVFDAADAITTAGHEPTVPEIRDRIGGGSYSTIQKHLDAWRMARAARASAEIAPVPTQVAEMARQLAHEVWWRAKAEADAQFADERAAMERVRSEVEAARDDAVHAADELTAQLDQANEKIANIHQALETSQADQQALRAEQAGLQARLADGRERIAELQCQLAEAQEAAGRAREQAAQLQGRLDAAEAQNIALLSRVVSDGKVAGDTRVRTGRRGEPRG